MRKLKDNFCSFALQMYSNDRIERDANNRNNGGGVVIDISIDIFHLELFHE